MKDMRGWMLAACCVLGLLQSAAQAQALRINEFMGANATTLLDSDGDPSDWLELYNPGLLAQDLGGCFLSDDPLNPLRWQIPAGSVPAQGFLLIWVSGKNRQDPDGALHAGFSLSASGEPLLLTAADGTTLLDQSPATALGTDISCGRLPDGGESWSSFALSTPAASNSGGLQAQEPPQFSLAPGWYAGPQSLQLWSQDPLAEIRYTLDGSPPTPSSPLYQSALSLDDRATVPNGISLIPTNYFPPEQFRSWHPPNGNLEKLNIIRARSFRSGFAPSPIMTGTYIVRPDLLSLSTVPIVSLSTEPDNLFGYDNGIYVPGANYNPQNIYSGNYALSGDDWERPMHVEIFDEAGSLLLSQDAGARIHGSYTVIFPQKSLRLYARDEYGDPTFSLPLFPGLNNDSYSRFLIRNAGDDWLLTGFRDLMIHTVCSRMGVATQAGRPVSHFINGEYWGLANLRERVDQYYLENHYGVDEDDVTILTNNAQLDEGLMEESTAYLTMRSFAETHDLSLEVNYEYMKQQMDITDFTSYMVSQLFINNTDWPGNNIKFWKRNGAPDPQQPLGHDGRWRWLLYDLETGFKNADENTIAYAASPVQTTNFNPPWSTLLFRRLLQSADFRDQFVNSVADHLNSTFQASRVISCIDSLASRVQPEIPRWQQRWGHSYEWAVAVQLLRNFALARPAHLRQHVLDQFALPGLAEVVLDCPDEQMGYLVINSLALQSTTPGIAAHPYPWTGSYFQGVPVTVRAVSLPGHHFVAWQESGSTQPEFTVTLGGEPLHCTALFAQDPADPLPLLAWHFNNLPSGTLVEVPADQSLLPGAGLSYPGTGAGYLDRVDGGSDLGALPDTPAGMALRVRNPSASRELLVRAPSTGHEDLELGYAAMRTSNGAQFHAVQARPRPDAPWQTVADSVAVAETFQLYTLDLSRHAELDDQDSLELRFVFQGSNAAGSSGNQRFDNLQLSGRPIQGVNQPPVVVLPVPLQHRIEGGDCLTLDLEDLYQDPEGDWLSFAATGSDSLVLGVELQVGRLVLCPLGRGDAWVHLTATDGIHAPVAHDFRVLVHPAAARPPFAFEAWSPAEPERSHPAHMLFLQGSSADPGLAEPLEHPYYIAHDDYHADDADVIGFPYMTTGRSRINGLDGEGISFINTGRDRDLGGALLALDTREQDSLKVSWLAGTLLPNSRVYALRLQVRTSAEAPFSDLLVDGQPVEYLRNSLAGHSQAFGPLALPDSLLGREHVELFWRYYHVSGTSGTRAQLRLDNIRVTGSAAPVAPLLRMGWDGAGQPRLEWEALPPWPGLDYLVYRGSGWPQTEFTPAGITTETHWVDPEGVPADGIRFYRVTGRVPTR